MKTRTIRITDNEPLENGDILRLPCYLFDAVDTLVKYYKKQGYKKSDISVSVISGAIYDVTLTGEVA
jgi:hypothetical protein